MQTLSVSAQQILDSASSILTLISNPKQKNLSEILISVCQPPEKATANSLVFVSKQDQLNLALKANSPVIIAHKSLQALLSEDKTMSATAIFITPQINMAMALTLTLLDAKTQLFQIGHRIHPSAIIHPLANISESAVINPLAVIGAHATIGANSVIGTHTVIEAHVKIGEHTILHPHVVIGAFCEIGNNCEIHPHTTIGSDGYGYASNSQFKHTKIPQVGIVKIHDHVEIGSSVAIDRAALTETVIHSGTKIDNLCHIAHNCSIGEDSFVTAGFFTAGSTHIGKRFVTGGNTAVADHVTIADGVILAGRSTVTGDIKVAGQFGGLPIQPVREYLKTLASLGQLNHIRKQVQKIMKHLHLEDEN